MKTTLSVLLSLCALPGFSQLIFTESNAMFQPGQSSSWTLQEGNMELTFPTSGTNNIWDFTGLPTNSTYGFVFNAIDLNTSTCVDSYPNADFVFEIYTLDSPQDIGIIYCKLDAQILELLGEYYGGNDDCTPYINAETFMQFPFELGDSFTDTYEYNSGNEFDITYSYVASGSVTLPNGDYYSDCALVAMEQGEIQYQFFTEMDGVMVAIFNSEDDGSYFSYLDMLSMNAGTKLQSEPSWNLLTTSVDRYRISGLGQGNCTIGIYDSSGRMIESIKSQGEFSIDQYAPGIYLVEIVQNQQRKTFRVSKG